MRSGNPNLDRRVWSRLNLAQISWLGPCGLWLAATVTSGFAQPPPQSAPDAMSPADPFSMDLDSLFNTKVTTASKFPEKLSDAAAVVTVVTQDELRRFGGVTLLRVLQRVAGLNISSGILADGSLIVVRGDQTRVDAGHILILINGRPVREILEGGVSSDLLESFPINILDRIEVVKGPGSVLYGSGAFSGVINLITMQADGQDFRISAAGGAAGERSVTERIILERGALSIVEGGQFHNWPQWGITERAFNAAGVVTAQNGTLQIAGIGSYLGINYKGLSFMSSYTAQEHPTFAQGILGDLRLKRGFGDLGYELDASARWKMTFNATYSRSVMDVPQFPSIHRDSYEGDLEWTNFITISENDRLTFGAVYNHIQGVETYFGVKPSVVVANGTRNAGEVYVQYEHKLSDALKLIGGVQLNKTGAIGIHADPRGGILWTPSSHLSVKLLYGAAYNAPSLDQTLIHHPGLQGNPNLVPENVGTLDAQVSYQNDRIQASVDYFHSRQTDLIILNGGVFPIVYYNNRSAVNFQGGEAEGKYYLKHDWFLVGSVLYQVDNSGAAGQNLSTNPSTLVKGGVSYLSANGTAASLFDAYQGAIAGYKSTLNPPSTAFHSISAHACYDLSKRWWKESARGFALFLNADNLLNKPVWLPALGISPANTIPVMRGRTVFFGIEAWQK